MLEENKVMNSEQVKIEKFYNRLWKNSVSKALSWVLVGIFVFIIMILCMLPAQEMYSEETPLFLSAIVTMISFMMLNARSGIYDRYTADQKTRLMVEILRYHPVSRKEIWKYKTKNLTLFLAKITGVGLALQIVVSLIAYGEISWLNFFYVIVSVFVFPLGGVLTMDSIVKRFVEEI